MKNRAKCKLCSSIIESFHSEDLVICNCGEISVEAGTSLKCSAKNWNNFVRVDDEGNEIVVTIKKDNHGNIQEVSKEKPNKKDLLNMLDYMIENIEKLPPHAMSTSVNHYDLCSALLLLSSIFRAED